MHMESIPLAAGAAPPCCGGDPCCAGASEQADIGSNAMNVISSERAASPTPPLEPRMSRGFNGK
jgi:hypothetical protein